MDVSSVGSGTMAEAAQRNVSGRSFLSRSQASVLLRALMGFVLFVTGTVGCSERRKIESSVGVTEQTLSASE